MERWTGVSFEGVVTGQPGPRHFTGDDTNGQSLHNWIGRIQRR